MALCEAGRFELLLSDIMMPEIDGHELVQWLAARYPDTLTVLMTGYDGGCANCPYAPRCHLLYKPFRPAEAVQVIHDVLKTKRPVNVS